MPNQAIELILTGRVQGVGFRPFVYRLAQTHNIDGWVRNNIGQVEIHAEGSSENLRQFRQALIEQSPSVSAPAIQSERNKSTEKRKGFYIVRSETMGQADIHTPADLAACPDCEQELNSPANRRYRYPFINCTSCGPRYTIIDNLPYDRASTSMANFKLCPSCAEEYKTPQDRRFHAEPNACPDCGPQLSFSSPQHTIDGNHAALGATIDALRHGRIVAVKSVGGYHLMCDASNDVAVARLRKHKQRPDKPLALMVPATGPDQLQAARELVHIDNTDIATTLRSQSRPIVLLPKQAQPPVATEIAPGLNEFGVMLPPSPLHSLICDGVGKALVATSGNISGEPVLTDDQEAQKRLQHVAEAWLFHDRKIVRPADDSVQRIIAGRARTIRLGRGLAPLELDLPTALDEPVLAVGGHLKNTVSLAWDNRIVVSPHIGDLSSHRGMLVFEQVIEDLQCLYQIKAMQLICDAHPQYASSRWAKAKNLPLHQVQHHRAHASALSAELPQETRVGVGLMFTWDGIGYGDDGDLWGGETFLGTPGAWQRVASLRPFQLLGGDRAASEPWRSAAALHWELGLAYRQTDERINIAHRAWQKGLNRYRSSAAGRLFDAAASMLGLVQSASFEGHAPMQLEAIAESVSTDRQLPIYNEEGIQRIDWAPLLEMLQNMQHSIAHRAGLFHRLLANTIVGLALEQRQRIDYVGLTGGVFQNRLLTELTIEGLRRNNIPCFTSTTVPVNDGGISYGQVIEFAARSHAV